VRSLGEPPIKTLLVVFHTLTNGTAQMADACIRGASVESNVRVLRLPAVSARATDVVAADGIVFATPENLGGMSGLMKDFFDRTYYAVIDRVAGRPYALMVCAGSDGQNAVRQVERIAVGWRLRSVTDPVVVCTNAQTAESILAPKTIGPTDLRRCEEVGATLAAGLAAGVF
jgi:multimeric flavodoxin WrbA